VAAVCTVLPNPTGDMSPRVTACFRCAFRLGGHPFEVASTPTPGSIGVGSGAPSLQPAVAREFTSVRSVNRKLPVDWRPGEDLNL
jgi:hypothetical protein